MVSPDHYITLTAVHLWQNDTGLRGGDRPAGGNRSRSVRGWPGRSVLFVGPLLRAHLPITGLGAMVVLPDGSRAPSGGGSRWTLLPCPVWTQASRRHRRLVHRAELHRCTGGLGAIGHQQAAPGIYRCIACHYYQRPKQGLNIFHIGAILCLCQFDRSEFMEVMI